MLRRMSQRPRMQPIDLFVLYAGGQPVQRRMRRDGDGQLWHFASMRMPGRRSVHRPDMLHAERVVRRRLRRQLRSSGYPVLSEGQRPDVLGNWSEL